MNSATTTTTRARVAGDIALRNAKKSAPAKAASASNFRGIVQFRIRDPIQRAGGAAPCHEGYRPERRPLELESRPGRSREGSCGERRRRRPLPNACSPGSTLPVASGLPWQQDPSPYRVWVSEVMLQQTQVATVIPYFERFMARFPDVLRRSPPRRWTRCCTCGPGSATTRARAICRPARKRWSRDTAASFPRASTRWSRSPASAARPRARSSRSRGERHPILDGNVKRVLARDFGIEGDPGAARCAQQRCGGSRTMHARGTSGRLYPGHHGSRCDGVHAHAPRLRRMPDGDGCIAQREGRQQEMPGAKRKRLAGAGSGAADRRTGGRVARHVARAPARERDLGRPVVAAAIRRRVGARALCHRELAASGPRRRSPPIEHGFTHFDLCLNPLRVHCAPGAGAWGKG